MPQWWVLKRFHCRAQMPAVEREDESERARDTTEKWSTDSKTFNLVPVTVAPGGHFGHSVLYGCMTGSCNVLHQWFSCGFWESTLVIFASDESVEVCVCLCECVVDSFSIRQQEGLTDCVWEEGGGTVGVLTTCLCAHMLTQIHTHTRT